MAESVLLLVLGGLIVQPLGYQLTRGGWRKRKRAELLGEFDVLDRLEGRPEFEARLNLRIDRLLEQYEPSSDALARPPDQLKVTIASAVVLMGIFILFNETKSPDLNASDTLVAGACLAGASNLVAAAIVWLLNIKRRWRYR